MTRKIESKTSVVLDRQIPEYVRENFDLFVSFIKQYYNWLDSEDNVDNRIKNLIDQRQVSYSSDPYRNHLLEDFLVNIPKNLQIDYEILIRNIKAFYASKGTEASIRYFFNIFRSINNSFSFYVHHSNTTPNLVGKTFTGSLSGSKFTITKSTKIDYTTSFVVIDLLNFVFPETNDVIINIDDELEFYSTTISNFNIDISYPKLRILRSSNGVWQNSTIVVIKSDKQLNLAGKSFTSSINNNSGFIDTQNLIKVDTNYYYELKISFNNFIFWDDIENIIVDDIEYDCASVCASVNIVSPGSNYSPGDEFNIKRSGNIVGKIRVKSSTKSKITKFNVVYGGYNYEIGDEIIIGDNLGIAVVSELGALNSITGVKLIYSNPWIDTFQSATINSVNGYDAELIFYDDNIGNIKEIEIVDSGIDITSDCIVEIPARSLIELPANIDINTSTLKYTDYTYISDSGFINGSDKLQDNYFYQDYSYVVKSETPIDFSSIISNYNKLVHPAGTKSFFTSVINSSSTLIPSKVNVKLVDSYKELVIFSYGYKRFIDYESIDFTDTFKSISPLRINTLNTNLLKLPLIISTNQEMNFDNDMTIQDLMGFSPTVHRFSMQVGHKDTIIQII